MRRPGTRSRLVPALVGVAALCALGCASGEPAGSDAGGDSGRGEDAAIGERDAGPPCAEDVECDDGDPCNGVESCVSTSCVPGVSIDCDDGVSCTIDACDPADGSCSSVPDDGVCPTDLVCDPGEGCVAPSPCTADDECDDGLLCNGVETCDAAFGCRRGEAPACDDGIECTIDACDPAGDGGAGACAHRPDAAVCGDGRACNGDEACDPASPDADALGCVSGAPLVCDDGVACTADACDEGVGGCMATPDAAPCQDGVFCNGAEVCVPASGCAPGAPPTCDDSIGCTIGRCDAASDVCVQSPDTAFCQDGLVCNGSEACDVTGSTPGRGCVGGVPIDCSDGLVCTADICNEPAGTCSYGGSDADMDGYEALGCGSGTDCNDLSAAIHPGAVELCDGLDNDCSGTIDDGSGMECALGSGARTCTTGCGTAGSRVCNAACTLTPCVASSETCNDCDDDGNGLVDEGLPCRRGTTASCTTSCATAGSRTCAPDCSGYGACRAATETCNDCDDDGNGLVDDGLTCRRGTTASCTTSCGTSGSRICAADCSGYGACRAPAETCNDCDDDGNGMIDDGLACRRGATQSCTTACGSAGTRTCAMDCSGYGACVATEVCNGCDDDADGAIDETFTCVQGVARSCTTACGSPGSEACNLTCSGYGACGGTEACNNCDDDGDGSVDEDFACRQGATMGCTSSCGTAGVRTCSATCSGFGGCVATEVCNGCDDDGDGAPDDGFACVGGSSRSCTTACTTTGTQSCNGSCSAYGTCTATEVCNGCDDDGDGTPDDGFTCAAGSTRTCTSTCGTSGNQTCNGSCSAYGTCAATEVCNGCDDDADGAPDDGFTCVQGATSACTTACSTAGTRVCNGACSGFSACVAATETCGNGCDDNGNGMIDEGCGPSNDTCAGAIALSMAGMGTTVTGTTVGATNQAGCGSGGDVYYSFTLTQREVVYVDTEGSSYDTEVGFANTCTGTLSCNDDSCFGLQSQLVSVLNPGSYYVVVGGFGGSTGTFNLRFQHLPTGNATPIVLTRPATGGTVSGNTSGTGTLTSTCGSASGPEQMYYFSTCTYSGGAYSGSLCGAIWDTQLYFRDATAGTEACNDDSCGLQSSLSGTVSGGGGLRAFYVDGWGGASGAYTLTYTVP